MGSETHRRQTFTTIPGEQAVCMLLILPSPPGSPWRTRGKGSPGRKGIYSLLQLVVQLSVDSMCVSVCACVNVCVCVTMCVCVCVSSGD